MKYSLIICFWILIFSHEKLLSQQQCPIGDTCFLGILHIYPPTTCTDFYKYSYRYSYTHLSGTDFFVKTPDLYCLNCDNDSLLFSPTRLGIQKDTIILTVIWWGQSHTDCGAMTYSFPVWAEGIAKNSVLSSRNFENVQINSFVDDSYILIFTNFFESEKTSLELYDALGRQLPMPISQLPIPSGASSQKIRSWQS